MDTHGKPHKWLIFYCRLEKKFGAFPESCVVVVGILTTQNWLWRQQLAWPCWPSRKCDCYGSRQSGSASDVA
jgi:hypothetical protein